MKRDGVTLREMDPDDHSQLVALWNRFPGNTLTGADSASGFRKFLHKNHRYCFVAEFEGNIAGSVMAGNDARRGYIYHLAVDEDLQGSGIGGRLMEASENALRADGVEKAHLFIYNDNPAILFYEKSGWHRRTDITVMSKVLIGENYMGTRRDG